MYVRALRGKEKAWGLEHTSTLDTVNNLAVLYKSQGKMAEAEEMYVRALRGYEKALQSETIPALNTVYNLGLLYCDQGRMEQAKTMLHRAVLGRQKVLGPHHPYTLKIVNYLKQLDVEVAEK